MPIGFWLGMILGALITATLAILYLIIFCGSGVFMIDSVSEPGVTRQRLVLNELPGSNRKRWFVIKVDTKADLSQE